MRIVIGIGLLAVMLTGTGCSRDPKLDGTYTIIAIERRGESKSVEELKEPGESDQTFKFEGNRVISDKEYTVTFKTDTSKSPKEITFTETRKSGKTSTQYGIYKLEGDTLTLCMADSDNPEDRPKEFKTNMDSMAILIKLKKK